MMKETMVERHRLFPYINTHAHLETYAKGIYFLEITTNSGVVNKKLILQ